MRTLGLTLIALAALATTLSVNSFADDSEPSLVTVANCDQSPSPGGQIRLRISTDRTHEGSYDIQYSVHQTPVYPRFAHQSIYISTSATLATALPAGTQLEPTDSLSPIKSVAVVTPDVDLLPPRQSQKPMAGLTFEVQYKLDLHSKVAKVLHGMGGIDSSGYGRAQCTTSGPAAR